MIKKIRLSNKRAKFTQEAVGIFLHRLRLKRSRKSQDNFKKKIIIL
jgi:hypothetical protein